MKLKAIVATLLGVYSLGANAMIINDPANIYQANYPFKQYKVEDIKITNNQVDPDWFYKELGIEPNQLDVTSFKTKALVRDILSLESVATSPSGLALFANVEKKLPELIKVPFSEMIRNTIIDDEGRMGVPRLTIINRLNSAKFMVLGKEESMILSNKTFNDGTSVVNFVYYNLSLAIAGDLKLDKDMCSSENDKCFDLVKGFFDTEFLGAVRKVNALDAWTRLQFEKGFMQAVKEHMIPNINKYLTYDNFPAWSTDAGTKALVKDVGKITTYYPADTMIKSFEVKSDTTLQGLKAYIDSVMSRAAAGDPNIKSDIEQWINKNPNLLDRGLLQFTQDSYWKYRNIRKLSNVN